MTSCANVRLFLAFRVLFNARFYYPVFTILFLDFGLTLEQFALLNAVWAATIVISEVPSGALADRLGRVTMVRLAAVLMVVEMVLIAFLPAGPGSWVFLLFLINRIVSGLAEAAASGADEALAYDSLKALGREGEWPKVLERLMRYQGIGFVVAMSAGAAVYDPVFLSRLFGWFGLEMVLEQSLTMRFPLLLTLLTALIVVWLAWQMCEPERGRSSEVGIGQAWRDVWRTARWILATPFALVVIVGAVVFDSSVRLFATIQSEYYRLIELPEATFGIVGSGIALTGILLARYARMAVEHLQPWQVAVVLGVWVAVGLGGIALAIPYFGVIFAMTAMVALPLSGFFTSHYLNRMADSSQRATLLSFRGLATNLGYGSISLGYGFLVQRLRIAVPEAEPFATALVWILMTFSAVFAVWFLASLVFLRKSRAAGA